MQHFQNEIIKTNFKSNHTKTREYKNKRKSILVANSTSITRTYTERWRCLSSEKQTATDNIVDARSSEGIICFRQTEFNKQSSEAAVRRGATRRQGRAGQTYFLFNFHQMGGTADGVYGRPTISSNTSTAKQSTLRASDAYISKIYYPPSVHCRGLFLTPTFHVSSRSDNV